MRDEPGKLSDFLIACQGQNEPGAADGFEFNDFCDLDVAYFPEHSALLEVPGLVERCFLR
jgi:hypothetical protein